MSKATTEAWTEMLGKGAFSVRRRGKIITREYNVGVRLGRAEALRRARRVDKRAGYGDHRGFTYDPETGRATLT